MKSQTKKLRPSQWIALGFIGTILVGTVLLCLPISNKAEPLSVLNQLFIATSATCVTGLTVASIATQYTLFGQVVILLLVQIGGLGLVSVLSFILMLSKHRFGLDEKRLIQESVGKATVESAPLFLKRVVGYTFLFEGIGAVLLFVRFVSMTDVSEALWLAVFHSVSAFCNAGLDLLGSTSLVGYANDWYLNLVIMALIVCGGLGFTVWFDLSDKLTNKSKRKLRYHTVVVLKLTGILTVLGMVLFMMTEWSNPGTLAGLNFADKTLVSLFQSVTLRTAGFSTVNYANLREVTKLMMLVFMLIGGSAGGTAGGIKTTTVLVLLLYFVNVRHSEKDVVYRKRRISVALFTKAFYLVSMYGIVLFGAMCILLCSDTIASLDLLFESVSAIATVGLSVGITSSLSVVGKLVMIVLMTIGRIGPMAVFVSLFENEGNTHHVEYPDADLLIG